MKSLFSKVNKNSLFLLLSFILSSFLMFLIFMMNGMNEREYLVIRSDFLDVVGFYKDFARNFINHNSILFNYTSGLGINNILSVAGIFSPFNILYVLFYKANINLVTMWIIILKVGFSAAAFQFFSIKTLKNNHFFSVLISVFYSLNAFAISYGTIQVGWLEVLIILPLLVTATINCLEQNKRVWVILLYAYLVITNFYFAYVVGFFMLLFVLLYICFMVKEGNKLKDKINKLLNWLLCIVIAVMLSACIWVPTLFFLASNRVPDSTEIKSLNVSLFQIFNSMFWGMSYGIKGNYAYIYSGIPVLILFPLFFFNKKVNNNEKWFYGILTFIIFLSMVSDRLNTFWHVFDQPDDFWYRYSFLICFCICTIASRQIALFDDFVLKKYLWLAVALISFYQLMLHTALLWDNVDYLNTNAGFVFNLIYIVLWCVVIFGLFGYKKLKAVFAIASILIMSFELISLSKRELGFKVDAKEYYGLQNELSDTVSEIQRNDNGLYRMIVSRNDTNYNTDTYYGYNGIADFGNQEKYAVRKFLSNVGFATSPRVSFENGYTPVSEMILGVKYEINPKETSAASDESVEETGELDKKEEIIEKLKESNASDEDNYPAYSLNPYALQYGYLINGQSAFYNFSGRNVFENMNEIVSSMTGIDEKCFVPISIDDVDFESDYIEFAEMDTGQNVFSRTGSEGTMEISLKTEDNREAFIQFENESPVLFDSDYYVLEETNSSNYVANSLGVSSAVRMKYDSERERYYLHIISKDTFSPEVFTCDAVNIYYLDESVLKKQYDNLSSNQLEITNFTNGHIEGKIHVEGDKRLLFMSIPYDPGWRAYIDGQEVEAFRVFDGAFMAVWLPSEGNHDITFDFECPGLKMGLIITIGGLLALLSVVFEKKLKKTKHLSEGTN